MSSAFIEKGHHHFLLSKPNLQLLNPHPNKTHEINFHQAPSKLLFDSSICSRCVDDMMLSLTKALSSFPCQLRSPSQQQHRSILCSVIRSNANDGSNELKSSEPVRPPDGVEIRFKRGSRRRRRQEEEEPRKVAVVKDWDSMSLSEKAVELYVGEKGVLFWLNKFAYASIFIVIGGWILFRFVGPALNLYQLDAPPLPPTSMLKGS